MVEAALLLAWRFGPKENNVRSIIPPRRACVTATDNQVYKFAVKRPRVIGFVENPCSVLVQTELGTYMLSQSIHFTTIYPYMSFYTTDLPNDILKSILVRLPSEPGYLSVAVAVAKNWRRQILGSDGSFLRAFRAAHGGVPPLLGFFANIEGYGRPPCPFFTSTTAFGTMDLTPPPALESKHRRFVYDVRHGRVLLADGQLIVWDPLARRQDMIPTPRWCYFTNDSCGAAIICGCEHAGDVDCHLAPYQIVVAFSALPCFCPDEWNLDRICARIWSSETREWSELYSMTGSCDFDFKPSAVVAGAVHWLVGEISGILQFNLITKKLALIETPLDIAEFMLFPAENGKLGFVGVLGSHIIFFHLDISSTDAIAEGKTTWNIADTIPVDRFFPTHHGPYGSFASPWVVNYDFSESNEDAYDADDDDDDDYEPKAMIMPMQHDAEASSSNNPPQWTDDSWSDDDFDQERDAMIPIISTGVNVIGFIEEENAVLLHAAGMGGVKRMLQKRMGRPQMVPGADNLMD
uniref:F-box domain-containing protein n=1 Tax=Leersia perrieri TaxID=77586 RepID=A0A0D9XHN8_9ORYZ